MIKRCIKSLRSWLRRTRLAVVLLVSLLPNSAGARCLSTPTLSSIAMRTRQLLMMSFLLTHAGTGMAQGAWFYELGGAEPIARPAWTSYNAVPLVAAGDVQRKE
jgi:hypothetical protein